jgi:Na+/melibiose symporter-like transporter
VSTKGLDGYSIVQVIFAVAGVLGQLILFFGTKDYESFDPDFKQSSAGSVPLGTMIKETISNSQLIILMVGDAIRFTAFMGVMSMGTYYFTYVIGNMQLFTISMTVSSTLSLVSSFIAPKIATKIGKKNSALVSSVFGCIGYVCLGLFAKDSLVIYIICASVALVGSAMINACGVNLYLDCAEYQLYKTGKDTRTFTMSMFGIAIKVGIALSSLIIAFVLSQAGYEANNVADVGKLGLYIGLIPGILMGVYGLVMMFYKINDEKAREYAAHNFEAAQKAQAVERA